jgi:hypothetical protein
VSLSPAPVRRPLVIGGVVFVVVFTLIVGSTLAVLVVRDLRAGGPVAGAHAPASSPASSDPGSGGTTAAASCRQPGTITRSSHNPVGRLRGGGLEFAVPDGFDDVAPRSYLALADDPQAASAQVETDWVSTLTVASLAWQPASDYPGPAGAADHLLDCMLADTSLWDGVTTVRTVLDRSGKEVTVDGMAGHRVDLTLAFSGETTLARTSATRITVVVVDTPQGPSVFASDVAVGVPEHERAADAAYASLSGITRS